MIDHRKTDTLERWQIVAGCCQREKDQIKAINADLLAALEKIVLNAGNCPEYVVFQRIAEVAIAKAKGE